MKLNILGLKFRNINISPWSGVREILFDMLYCLAVNVLLGCITVKCRHVKCFMEQSVVALLPTYIGVSFNS